MTGAVEIRPVRDEDAAAVAGLCGELGYPADTTAVLARIAGFITDPDRAVLVAVMNGSVVGWIDVGIERHLQEDAKAIIGGLVVAESVRNAGIGLTLLCAAEDWAGQHGMTRIRVRSNAIRERAHRFYLRDGYVRVKTSAVFEKVIADR